MGVRRRGHGSAGAGLVACRLVAVLTALLLPGCTYVTFTTQERMAVEQELLVRSIERAIARLDTRPFEGRRAVFALHAMTRDELFTRELVAAHLRARGIQIVDSWLPADLQLEVFATVLGIDQSESLLGIPSLQVPFVGVPTPEIALFKWNKNRSHTELRLFAFDRATGRIIEQSGDAVGRAKYDAFKVLILITFSVSNLHELPSSGRPAPPP
jgi:hypothetical protein